MDNIQQTPFVRELASSDKRTRDKALDSLTLFIRSRRDLPLIEVLKIWKGLFFCFYHSDRPLTQQSLARSLSYTLVPSIPPQTLQSFLRAFWITMSRDFHALDRLRLDKYLYLIRCYVGVAFEVLLKGGKDTSAAKGKGKGKKGKGKGEKAGGENDDVEKDNKGTTLGKRKRGGDEALKEELKAKAEAEAKIWEELAVYLDMLEEGPLCPVNFDPDAKEETAEELAVRMHKGPDGLRYHLLDVWLDEIEKVAAVEVEGEGEGEGEEGKGGDGDGDGDGDATGTPKKELKEGVPMELLLRPIVRLQEKSVSKMVRKRAGEVLGDERLVEWGVRERKREEETDEEDEKSDEDEEWGGIDE
ncbi:hypothetical protein AJ79_06198 [Helicocarpus griseus UAMH5409]|uniref:Ribosomal RNA-processing protein 1 n=1 Tax=Helicocarpus griseus UAMH5409 TaxID=1447875 RepID=A0A2B7XG24_9EURO|nr:hypothetical protein AJ79_06198 [Helicocarpus griseus UAMH5409]